MSELTRAADLAEAALDAAAGLGVEAQATAHVRRSVRAAHDGGELCGPVRHDDRLVEITAFAGGHAAAALTDRVDTEALAECARRAAEAVADGPEHPGPASAAPATPTEGPDLGSIQPDPSRAARELGRAADRAGTQPIAARWTAAWRETAIVTSAGQSLHEQATEACLDVAVGEGPLAGRAQRTSNAVGDLDGARLVATAAERTATGEPTPPSPGVAQVVLGAEALASLLVLLGRAAFDGHAHTDGRGALAGKLGSRVAASSINLSDSPRFGATLQRGFDAEATPKRPLPLIQDGVAHRVCHDRRSAARAGAESTGHAVAVPGRSAGPRPQNLVLVGGGAAGVDELAGRLESGLVLYRLDTAVLVDRAAAQVRATSIGGRVVRDGVIEGVTGPVTIDVTLLELLSSVRDLSRSGTLISGSLLSDPAGGCVVCPAALVERVGVVG